MNRMKLFTLTMIAILFGSFMTPVVHAEEKVQVTFWHAMNGDHQEKITELTERFNASQDEIEVIEQNQGNYTTLQQSVMAAAASKDLPTMTQLTISNTPDYRGQGLLKPLDEYMTEENGMTDELFESIFDGFVPGFTYDGEVFALPFSKSVRLMFVNQDLLDELDVEAPKTWEEIRELGEKLKEAGHDIPALGLENGLTTEVETMARQNGAVWISDDLSEVEIASERAMEPIEFIQSLIEDGYARTAGEDDYMSGPFSQGETALYIGSSAGIPYILDGIETSGINVTTAEIPVYGEGDPLTIFLGNDLGIFSTATDEESEAAMKFMTFLLENTAEWAAATGYLPVTQNGLESEEWKEYVESQPMIEAAGKELYYGISPAGYSGAGEVFQEFELKLDAIMINDADILTEMEDLENLVKGHLGL